MNGEDQFEKRLQRQPMRLVPPAWRDEVLRAARSAAASAPVPARHGLASSSNFAAWLWSLLWPHPRAWAGLAALWLVVLGLDLAVHEPVGAAQQVSGLPIRQSPQMRELLRQQEQLLAELVGPIGKAGAEPPKSAGPQPRSQRRDEFFNA